MKNNDSAARQENKKALPKFALLVVLSLAGGVALGLVLTILGLENLGDGLEAAGRFFSRYLAAPLLVAVPILELAVCLPIYFGAKKKLAAWDGEDEAAGSEAEARLSVCIWITGTALILNLFLMSAMTANFVNDAGTDRMMPSQMFFSGWGAFMANFVVCVVLQQKLVDLTKRLGQCAMKAYQAMARVCLGLWLVFLLGGMFFDWGFLPSLAVCIVWGVGQSVYSWYAVKLGKPGGKV